MFSEIQTALSAIQATSQVVGTLSNLHTESRVLEAVREINQRLIETQMAVLNAQQRITELTEAKRQAEEKLMQLEDWKSEAARYELREAAPGILFYAIKPDHQGAEPFHYLCPHCFMGQRKSLMQRPTNSSLEYHCPACSYKARTQSPAPRQTPILRSHGFSGSY